MITRMIRTDKGVLKNDIQQPSVLFLSEWSISIKIAGPISLISIGAWQEN